jgi:hypothetical protein
MCVEQSSYLVKKYPAVAGYLIKMEQSSTKRDLKREVGFAKRMAHVAGKGGPK